MGLALLSLVYGNFAPLLEPSPAGPWREVLAHVAGAILLAAGAGLLFARTAPAGALLIAGFGVIWAISRAHLLLLEPSSVGSWYAVAEALGPLLGAAILFMGLRRHDDGSAPTAMPRDRALRVARVLFGAACVAYGAAHFAYAPFTASMVPAWIPGRTAVAYFTGVGHAAAGLSLLSGLLPRLAATLEALMMALFGLLVWLPSFFLHPAPTWAGSPQNQWSETLLTFLLAASAAIVAASLRRAPWGFARNA